MHHKKCLGNTNGSTTTAVSNNFTIANQGRKSHGRKVFEHRPGLPIERKRRSRKPIMMKLFLEGKPVGMRKVFCVCCLVFFFTKPKLPGFILRTQKEIWGQAPSVPKPPAVQLLQQLHKRLQVQLSDMANMVPKKKDLQIDVTILDVAILLDVAMDQLHWSLGKNQTKQDHILDGSIWGW